MCEGKGCEVLICEVLVTPFGRWPLTRELSLLSAIFVLVLTFEPYFKARSVVVRKWVPAAFRRSLRSRIPASYRWTRRVGCICFSRNKWWRYLRRDGALSRLVMAGTVA